MLFNVNNNNYERTKRYDYLIFNLYICYYENNEIVVKA